MSGNWREMFEPGRDGGRAAGVPPGLNPKPPIADDHLAIDLTEYRPWVVQRVRTRPALMLDLRRYESKAGFWTGWAMAYPSLLAVEYTGDRIVSLDFGARKFIIEGNGLDALVGLIQQGLVIAVNEHSSAVWPQHGGNASITSIRCL